VARSMRIHVDGKAYEVPERDQTQPLLEVLLHLGFNIPYFCWHPAMGSIGACRQCAVKLFRDEEDDRGRIEMSCMTRVKDGLRVSVDDEEVVEFRRRVIEWLMVNHPHDCPICDEGGECHLQDMTAMVGHVYRRFRGRKRTFRDQNLGPFVNHEMNRCIQCLRCFRFYAEYAGGRDFAVFASKDHTYFGRFEEGKLESEFSGNLVEVCPTGVFTDKTLKRHYARKWDLETAPAVCAHCGLGCNVIPGARDGTLRRVQARYHPEINGYFICDRGRYGYEFANDERRIRKPWVGRDDKAETFWDQALSEAREVLGKCRRIIGIGSPRASLESNHALKTLVGAEAFYSGLTPNEQRGLEDVIAATRAGPVRMATLRDIEWADAILVLGADPTNEAPMLDMAIRRGIFNAALDIAHQLNLPDWEDYPVRNAVERARGDLHILSMDRMKLDRVCTQSWRLDPPELTSLAWEIAGELEAAEPEVSLPGVLAATLIEAKRAVVIASADKNRGLLQAALEIASLASGKREEPALFFPVVGECNAMGAALLGGGSLSDALDELHSGRADGAVVLENDLFRRAPRREVGEALAAARCVVSLDHLWNATGRAADLVLPATTSVESTGTYVNNEGRAQRSYRVFVPPGEPRDSWRILRDLSGAAGRELPHWRHCEEVTASLAEAEPMLAGCVEAAPNAAWRDRVGAKIARLSFRHSGRTAVHAHETVFEPPPAEDGDSPLGFSMEGMQGEPPGALIPRYWRPGWNSGQALNGYRIESEGAARGQHLGKRLLEPTGGQREKLPEPASLEQLGEGEVWLVPSARVFGSEELSRLAPGIVEATPRAVLRLHPEEAERLSLAEGDLATVSCLGDEYTLPVETDGAVPRRVAIVPAGYPETAGIVSITRARIARVR
jgi:NADH-quinone oxidoreductase subunit G